MGLSAARAEITPTEARQELERRALLRVARESFPEFLARCWILSDDPIEPKPIRFTLYPYQQERAEAWAQHESECILKARQLGFTWLFCAYLVWRGQQDWTMGYFSRTEAEVREHCLDRMRFIVEHMDGERPAVQFRYAKPMGASFAGGGKLIGFPSTEDVSVGYTMQLVAYDEFAFHPFAGPSWRASQPTRSAGGQVVVFSTANPQMGPHGEFARLWQRSRAGISGLNAVFVPVFARPGRDEDWLALQRAQVGDDAATDAYYPRTEADAFVGRSGLVFPQFDPQRHVRPEHPLPWSACKWRVAGIDFGGTGSNVTALIPLGIYQDRGQWRMHQYLEFGRHGIVSEQEVAEAWHAIDKLGRFDATWVDAGSGTTTVVASLNAMGVRCHAANHDRASRLSWHAWVLTNDMLTLHSACEKSIEEYGGYRWVERTDPASKDRYQTGTPAENHADRIDARGYAILGAMTGLLRETAPSQMRIAYNHGRRDTVEAGSMADLRARLAARKAAGKAAGV